MTAPAVLEVAEAMYQAARSETPAKTPKSLDDLSPAAQRRYLNRAGAAIQITGALKALTCDCQKNKRRAA